MRLALLLAAALILIRDPTGKWAGSPLEPWFQSSLQNKVAHVRTADEIESTIAKLGNEQSSGLILGADNFLVNRREPIIKLANQHGVPTISAFRQFAVDGSLVAYGPDTGDISRRASAYVDRILMGERAPAPRHVRTTTDKA